MMTSKQTGLQPLQTNGGHDNNLYQINNSSPINMNMNFLAKQNLINNLKQSSSSPSSACTMPSITNPSLFPWTQNQNNNGKQFKNNQWSNCNNTALTLNKYQQHTKQKKIIQCHNPTFNPISNHVQQQKEQQHTYDINYVKNIENELNRSKQIIQNLMNQNNLLTMQLMQHKNYISCIQQNNNNYNKLIMPLPVTVPSVSPVTPTGPATLYGGTTARGKHFTLWSAQEIVEWIGSLQTGLFAKYKPILLENMMKEKIDGHGLSKITLIDLDRFGIKNAIHRSLLLNHIQSFIVSTANINFQSGAEGQNTITSSVV